MSNEYKCTDLYEIARECILEDGGLYCEWRDKISDCVGKTKIGRFFNWIYYSWDFATTRSHIGTDLGPVRCKGYRLFGYCYETYKRIDSIF